MIEVAITPRCIYAGQVTDLTVKLTNVDTGPCRNIVFRLALPRQVVRLSGDGLIKAAKLVPGDSVTGSLRVRVDGVGTWEVRSGNFSYRDRRDMPIRTDYVGRLTVVPPMSDELKPPRFTVTLMNGNLPCNEWGTLLVRLVNTGDTAVRNVGISLEGPLRVEQGGVPAPVPAMPPGESAELRFPVLANESGAVPIRVDVTCRYGKDQSYAGKWPMAVPVGKSAATDLDGVTVLYLSANPLETTRLRVEAELREIREELDKRRVAHLRVENRGAARPKDITDALLNVRPRIVHFSGHAAEDGRLYLERDTGHSQLVPPRALADLFRQVANDVKCVILNACGTAVLAEAIAEHVDHVIAMRDVVEDRAAIAFSIGFYQALAAGRSVEEAFGFGRTQVHLQLGGDLADLPVLFSSGSAGGTGAF